jgi:hypothetical protein
MTTTTPRLALPRPSGGDVADAPAAFNALTDLLDPKAVIFAAGTLAARPSVGITGQFYYASDGPLAYYTGSSWMQLGSAAPIEFALPTGSQRYDGRICHLGIDTMGTGLYVIWSFRYNASSSSAYKWEFLGGAPLIAKSTANTLATNNTAYAAPAGVFGLTLPAFAGDYDVELGGDIGMAAGGGQAYFSYSIGATVASDAWAIMTTGVGLNSVRKRNRHTGVASGAALVERMRVSSGTTSACANRLVAVTPVRVG